MNLGDLVNLFRQGAQRAWAIAQPVWAYVRRTRRSSHIFGRDFVCRLCLSDSGTRRAFRSIRELSKPNRYFNQLFYKQNIAFAFALWIPLNVLALLLPIDKLLRTLGGKTLLEQCMEGAVYSRLFGGIDYWFIPCLATPAMLVWMAFIISFTTLHLLGLVASRETPGRPWSLPSNFHQLRPLDYPTIALRLFYVHVIAWLAFLVFRIPVVIIRLAIALVLFPLMIILMNIAIIGSRIEGSDAVLHILGWNLGSLWEAGLAIAPFGIDTLSALFMDHRTTLIVGIMIVAVVMYLYALYVVSRYILDGRRGALFSVLVLLSALLAVCCIVIVPAVFWVKVVTDNYLLVAGGWLARKAVPATDVLWLVSSFTFPVAYFAVIGRKYAEMFENKGH